MSFPIFSNSRTTYFPITHNPKNQGGTNLVAEQHMTATTRKLVAGDPIESITLQELIVFANNQNIIIKMDIEGFECLVLKHYFSDPVPSVFIPYIFIEWIIIRHNFDNNCPDLQSLVKMFVDSGYTPWNMNNKKALDAEASDEWKPIQDVLWIHKDAKKL